MSAELSAGYRDLLKEELLRRIRNNPRYSLRSFARNLGVSPATLSGVLNGRRVLSIKKATQIAEQLDLAPARAAYFVESVAAEKSPSQLIKDRVSYRYATPPQDEVKRQLRMDEFEVIADWYHYPILNLTEIPGVIISPKSVSRMLGCSYVEAKEAIERLKRLGFLCEVEGKLVQTERNLDTPTDVPSAALRRRSLQILEKAKQSQLRDGIHERDFRTMSMAINTKNLPQAKKLIQKFRQDLCDLLEEGERDRVYELAISLFPISRNEESLHDEET